MKIHQLVECKSVPCYLPEEQAREVDEVVKSLPSDSAYQFRRKTVTDLKETDPTERTDVSYITTAAVDRDREIVIPDGVDLSVYDRNRVVLWQHDQGQPCGKCLWVKPDTRGVLAKTFYPARPDGHEGDWLPEKVWGLIRTDILRGKSVGFLPLEYRDPTEDEVQKGAERVFTRCLLLEYSCVAIPACPEALVTAINKGAAVDLLGLQWETVGRVKQKTRTVRQIDRTAEFCRAVDRIALDPDKLAERVLAALKTRGRI